MNNVTESFTRPTEIRLEEEHTIDFEGKILLYFKYWPLFLLCIAACLTSAYYFLKSEAPIYNVQAKILISDESAAPTVTLENQQTPGPKKVEDEIEILRSRTIMAQVVHNLGVATSYYLVKDLKQTDLYRKTPVQLIFKQDMREGSADFIEIVIKDKNSFMLKQAHSQSAFVFNQPLKNHWGKWKLCATKDVQDHIGETIRIYPENAGAVTDLYLSNFNANLQTDQSAIVVLTMQETVPARGVDIINGVVESYNMASISYKNKVNQSTLTFLSDRLNAITTELNTIEKKIENYKSSRGITNLSAESQVYLENVKNNDSRINEVDVQLQVLNEIQKYVNSPLNDGNAPAITGISDAGLVSLVEQLIKLETQRERLLSTTPEGNPLFTPLNRQLNTTKAAIRENIKGIKRTYLTTRNQLNHYNKKFESSIKRLPGQEREYINIKRQQSIKEELYIFLLQKREEAGMNNASNLLESRVVDQAHYGAPETHNPNYTYAMALIFGVVFPGGLLFVKEAVNNKVSSINEVQSRLEAPMIGELSYQKALSLTPVYDSSRTMMSEQFRILRTKLSHIHGRSGKGKIMLLTSGIPGEGKSMICRNLGAVMAAAGRKTIILDADLRKPQLAKAFGLADGPGMSDYLNGLAKIEDVVKASNVHPYLYVIAAGTFIENPSELLERPEMTDLIEALKSSFEEILIDSPPVELVTDALILTRFSDTTLFVVRQNYTHKAQLRSINRLCVDGSFKNMKVIFNGAESGSKMGYAKRYAMQYYAGDR